MELFTEFIAIIGLTGLAGVSLGAGAVGVGFPLMLIIGLLDGPEGGKLDGTDKH